jgi:hypothetical protein
MTTEQRGLLVWIGRERKGLMTGLAERWRIVPPAEAGEGPAAVIASEPAATAEAARWAAERKGATALVLVSPEAPPADLPPVEVPVLILEGPEDTAETRAAGQAWHRALPEAKRMFVYAAEGAPPAALAQKAATLIGDFLERGAAFQVRRGG